MNIFPATNNSSGIPPAYDPKNNGFRLDRITKICKPVIPIAFTITTIAAVTASILLPATILATALVVTAIVLGILAIPALCAYLTPYLPGKLQSITNTIQGICKEIFTVITLAALYGINLTKRDPKEKVNADKQPILLVHGYLHNSSAFIYLKYRLEKMGAGPVFTINLGHPFHSIKEYTQKVAEKAKEIEELTGRKDLCLIGYSMGGLVSMNYALQAAADKTIDVDTMHSPLNGTYLAKIGVGQCARDMEFKSPFIEAFKSKLNSSKIRSVFHIGSKIDPIIFPTSSALLEEHTKATKRHEFTNEGHASVLLSDEAADSLIDFYNSNNTTI